MIFYFIYVICHNDCEHTGNKFAYNHSRYIFFIKSHSKRHVVREEDFESVERRSQLWIDRFDAVLNMPLPFHKVGIAHLTCEYLGFPSHENFITALQMIPDSEMERLFSMRFDSPRTQVV